MGLYRTSTGAVVEMEDGAAQLQGFAPVTPEEQHVDTVNEAQDQLGEQRGFLGTLNTAAMKGASALSLGGTDMLLGHLLTDDERQRALAEIEAHPYVATGAEIGGTVLGALATGGSTLARTPAGYLGMQAGHAVEAGLARGGVLGTAQALGVMGVESAIQNGGQYLGHSAMADTETTVEGLAGAVGTGFEFGVAGGAVALGAVKGTIAARKLYSRLMDGSKEAALDATTAWTRASQELHDANEANLKTAKQQYDDINKAVEDAKAARRQANVNVHGAEQYARTAKPRAQGDVPLVMTDKMRTRLADMGFAPEAIAEMTPAQAWTHLDEIPNYNPLDNYDVPLNTNHDVPFNTSHDVPFNTSYDVPENARYDVQDPLPGQPRWTTKITKRPTPLTAANTKPVPGELADMVAGDIRGARSSESSPTGDNSIAGWLGELKESQDTPRLLSDLAGPAPKLASQEGELVRVSRDGRQFSVATADGSAPVASSREAEAALTAHMPPGFKIGGTVDIPRASVHAGPPTGAYDPNAIHIMRPSEIAEHGISGNELHPEHLDSIRSARSEGKRLDPIDINVTHDGQWHVEDGNHRLQDAAATDAPVALRFRQKGESYNPQAGIRDISDRLLSARTAETDTLGQQLAQMNKDAQAGKSLAEMRASAVEHPPNFAETKELLGKEMAARQADLYEALHEVVLANKEMDEIRKKLGGPLMENLWQLEPDDILSHLHEGGSVDDLVKNRSNIGEQLIDEGATAAGSGRGDIGEDQWFEDVVKPYMDYGRDEAKAGNKVGEAFEAGTAVVGKGKNRPMPKAIDDVAELADDAEKITRHEQASAKLDELLGDAGHPTAKAHAEEFRKADDEAMRKYTDSQARSIEDAETYGPREDMGPREATPKERVRYAKDRKFDAKLEYDKQMDRKAEAKVSYDAANDAFKASSKDQKLALKADAKAAKAAARGSKINTAANVGGAYELMDIPGMPKVKDLPVVGPLLSAYLKLRGIKAALGKMSGRVAATTDIRVAALAAKTRDRIAASVDRSLGLAEKAAKSAVRPAPSVAGVIGRRIFDDGSPDAPKGAALPEVAAVRMREINAYVNTPGAIETDVRLKMRGLIDPDVLAGIVAHRQAVMQYLLDNAPTMPDKKLLDKTPWQPSTAVAMKWARRYEAVNDPAGVFEHAAAGNITLEGAETVRATSPQLFLQAQQRMLQKASEMKASIPYAKRIQMSLLYDIKLDGSLEPDTMKVLQSVFKRPIPVPPPGAPIQPPTPSVAGQTNITALFQTTADRRAQR